jgi:hypothetical protein
MILPVVIAGRSQSVDVFSLGIAALGGMVIGSLAILFVLPALCGVVADAATRTPRERSLAS